LHMRELALMLRGMKAYSLDLREKILRAYAQRLGSPRALAALFGVSQSVVEKRLRRRRTSGTLAPRPHAGGRRALCDEAARALVRRLVPAQPEATLAEVGGRLWAQRGLRVSVPTMGRLVLALKRPRNNSRATPMHARPTGSSRRARPIRQRSRHSTPRASRAALHRAATARCPVCLAGRPGAHGASAPSRSTMGPR
jgi:transposase